MTRALLLLALTTTPAFAGDDAAVVGDAARGKAVYTGCVGCHGADGGGVVAMKSPALTALTADDVALQLSNYKAGLRGTHAADPRGAQMRPLVMTLDDAAMADVAAYVASLPEVKPAATLQGGDAETGATLYAACAGCHGAAGEGNTAMKAPAMAGQSDFYLFKTLQDFKSGVRGADPADALGATMAPLAGMLADDQAILDVVAYMGTL